MRPQEQDHHLYLELLTKVAAANADSVHASALMMVNAPERYPWSSARANLGINSDPRATPPAAYTALGHDIASRTKTYGIWLRSGVADCDLKAIRIYLQQERALAARVSRRWWQGL